MNKVEKNIVLNSKVRDITHIGLMVALLISATFISFPLPFTPIMITAQTIVINLIALTMSTKKATMVIIVYYFIGAIGLPVFSGGRTGIGTLIGPNGGYFIGFLLTVILISSVRGKKINLKKYILLTAILGMTLIYFFGALWIGYYNGLTFIENIKISVIPFIPGDIVKCIIASILAVRLNKIRYY